jgi:hypothetical protein
MRSRTPRPPERSIRAAMPLALLASGLITLTACGEGATPNLDRAGAAPAAVQPAAPAAVQPAISAAEVAATQSSGGTGLLRSPVAAGTYQIEPGNPNPVPIQRTSPEPLAASALTSTASAQAPASDASGTSDAQSAAASSTGNQQGSEIVVRPGLSESASALPTGRARSVAR